LKNVKISSVPFSKGRPRGFTRLELVVCCGVAALLLAVVVAPVWATTKSDPGRVTCFNNLRLIGRSVQSWTSDHGQQFPWRVMVQDGGTRMSGSRPGNVFVDYATFSNELVTPRILACPSDAGVRTARHFGFEPDGGLLHPLYRNAAVSYPLNMDGSPNVPGSWLTGDRNFRADFGGSLNSWPCSAGVIPTVAIITMPVEESMLAWTNSIHGAAGHVLTTDGAVEFTYTPRLREIILQRSPDDGGQIHFLKARP
jgi:hypothetical protein